MENVKKSNEFEPTLLDVLEAVQTGFGKMEEKFEQVDDRFDKIDVRFDKLEKRVGAVEITLEGMKETLESIEHAVDKDAEAIINHEDRVSHLEKLGGITSVPAAHLVGLE